MWAKAFVFVVISLVIFKEGSLQRLPNFVFILTDDQDLVLNGMTPMVNTINLIGNEGATFVNAFVNTPVCCPSRSTILTGQYIHNHGVTNNSIAGNCSSLQWQQNFESISIAALLKENQNYTTFYAGKYLNNYGSKEVGGTAHVPPGYDWWIGLKGNSVYYNYSLSINGTDTFFTNTYLTDLLANYSLEFLNQADITTKPFFMMVTPPAAHAPFTPADRHMENFTDVEAVRNPAFNYSSHDKHWLVSMLPEYLPSDVTILDNIHRNRWRTLLAVDEMVASIISRLDALQILNETYIIFASDHGYHIGQFTQPWDKRQPYDSDIRIPLLIRGPNIEKKSLNNYPVAAVDWLPTILDLANITNYVADGKSFKNELFASNVEKYNKTILIEYWGEGNERTVDQRCGFTPEDSQLISECLLDNWCKCQDSKNNTYNCVLEMIADPPNEFVTKYCQFVTGFYEAYNLKNDPYELINIYEDLNEDTRTYYQNLLNELLLT